MYVDNYMCMLMMYLKKQYYFSVFVIKFIFKKMGCCCTCCCICCTCCACCKRYDDNTEETNSQNQLTKEQDAFLSSYKLIVYLSSSPSIRTSKFNLIEEEFEKTFNKKIDEEALYKFYKI